MSAISIKEQQPEFGVPVLLYGKTVHTPRRWWVAYQSLQGWTADAGVCTVKIFDVTHWVPLPEPPETSEQRKKSA